MPRGGYLHRLLFLIAIVFFASIEYAGEKTREGALSCLHMWQASSYMLVH